MTATLPGVHSGRFHPPGSRRPVSLLWQLAHNGRR